ncbi:MBL fold metallo-hydrolase [Aquimarina sp. U1-2]|uniref:MBL fold metallo-hydrolase n=1 Tax=Aquimarina sp. U1-2 TaxID=2823141 RepID=UPI001AEC8D1B|nr:MBL fold metallo-hydrolase [Aquimarina sp. U1-2]MBP2831844.1 MBL fold metallo-hydrolase [Aquimarina sp. U1-2]
MNRRNSIKTMITAGIGFSLPLPLFSKTYNKPNKIMSKRKQNTPFYHFEVGDFDATVISDGQSLFPAYPLYAVNVKEEEVAKSLTSYFLPEKDYLLQCNCLLLERENEKILIDTGAGKSLGDGFGMLNDNLKKLGVTGEEITAVLLTHCHLDHIGGLTMNEEQVFPNAVVHICEKEWNFWSTSSVDLSSMPIEQGFRDNFKNAVGVNLVPFKNNIKTFRYGEEVLSGIQAIDASGHSPGHTCFWIKSGADSLLHTGDIFHHPAFDLKHPEWATAFDQDAKQAYKKRIKVVDMAVAERITVLSYHTPFPAFGNIQKLANGYQWIPSTWLI